MHRWYVRGRGMRIPLPPNTPGIGFIEVRIKRVREFWICIKERVTSGEQLVEDKRNTQLQSI